MRTYNVKIDDAMFQSMQPYFKGEDAMQAWIEKQLHNVFVQFIRERSSPKSTTETNDVLEKLEAIKDDPDGFLKLADILRPSKYSAEELRDEYIEEKYGV